MKPPIALSHASLLACILLPALNAAGQMTSPSTGRSPLDASAGSTPLFLSIGTADGEPVLSIYPNRLCRIEASTNLADWTGLATFDGTNQVAYTDSAAAFQPARFYRYAINPLTNAVTGDHLDTADGEVTFHPVNHGTFILTWKGTVIYSDPVGGAARFQRLPRPDLILVTHNHPDHFDAATLAAVRASNTVILAPAIVSDALPTALKEMSAAMSNGAVTNLLGMSIEAVPAYNERHPRGVGNGYVLTIGGKRIYISGDTGDTPELRALPNIDVAFLCMNLPFTMSVDAAAEVVRSFRPKTVYPYHYSDSDLNRFKRLVGTDLPIEVRLRDWY